MIRTVFDKFITLPKWLTYIMLSASCVFAHSFSYSKYAYFLGDTMSEPALLTTSVYLFITLMGFIHAAAISFLYGMYFGNAARMFDYRSLNRYEFTQLGALTFTVANIALGLISFMYYAYSFTFVFAPAISFLCYTAAAAGMVYYLIVRYRATVDRGQIFTKFLVPFFVYYLIMFIFGGA